jgi:hypothetical protein
MNSTERVKREGGEEVIEPENWFSDAEPDKPLPRIEIPAETMLRVDQKRKIFETMILVYERLLKQRDEFYWLSKLSELVQNEESFRELMCELIEKVRNDAERDAACTSCDVWRQAFEIGLDCEIYECDGLVPEVEKKKLRELCAKSQIKFSEGIRSNSVERMKKLESWYSEKINEFLKK